VNDGGGNGDHDVLVSRNGLLMAGRMWKLQDLDSAVIWSEKERCSSKMKPRLRAECVVLRGYFCILASCCLSPMRRNSVLGELRVTCSRLAVIQEEISCKTVWSLEMLE